MQITDLSYCEEISENDLALGSAGVLVAASAGASGTSAEAAISTDSWVREFTNGGSIAIGLGTAKATGTNPTASVTVAGEGDIVLGKTGSKSSNKVAVARGIVIAIDLPNG